MNEWDKIVILRAIAEAQIEALGMVAENEMLKADGKGPVYGREDFAGVIDRMNSTFEAHRA